MSDYPTVLFQRFDEINSWSDSGWKISLGFNKIAVKFILYRSVECSPHPRKKKTFCWTCCRYFDQTLAFYILLLSLRFNSEASIWHWDSKLKKVFQKKKIHFRCYCYFRKENIPILIWCCFCSGFWGCQGIRSHSTIDKRPRTSEGLKSHLGARIDDQRSTYKGWFEVEDPCILSFLGLLMLYQQNISPSGHRSLVLYGDASPDSEAKK